MHLEKGSRLGQYEILAPLGAGGMGEVYRARDISLGRDVALKILPDSYSGDADRLRRFTQEAQAAAALNHPNILTIYQIGQELEQTYIVSELLEGETLRERLRPGPLPVRKALDYALQVAHGLAAAHEIGTIWPGHGPVIDDALGALDYYIAHRSERLQQVESALADLGPEGLTVEELPRRVVEIVYADVDQVLWGAAELSVRAQLAYLAQS